MTQKLYLNNTYLFHFEGVIQKIGTDEKGSFITLDQTAFYPQGGGQPSDRGMIKNDYFEVEVIHVQHHGDEIKHYITTAEIETLEAQKILGIVNAERRLLNARYHTAGHLLGNIVEILNPDLKAIKGHSFPGEAYVEFQGKGTVNEESLQIALDNAIAKNEQTRIFEITPQAFEEQFYKLPHSVPHDKKFRAMQIGAMLPVPCGGTHLSSLGQIGVARISKVKIKNNCLRISYEVK